MINIFSRQTLNIIPCLGWAFCYPAQNYKFYYTPQHSWGFIIKVNENSPSHFGLLLKITVLLYISMVL